MVDNEIKRRKKDDEPNVPEIDTSKNEPKIQQIYGYLSTNKLDTQQGVYVFKYLENVIYVGKTTEQNFKDRLKQHVHYRRPFVEEFDGMEFYCLDQRQGSALNRIGEFESLMIFKHNPKYNGQSPESETIKVALEILRTEIKELKNTG